MIYTKKHKKGGFIELIAIIVIAVLIISYFGFDLAGLLEDSQTKENIDAVFGFIGDLWRDWFKRPVVLFWEHVVVGFFWEDVLKTLLNR